MPFLLANKIFLLSASLTKNQFLRSWARCAIAAGQVEQWKTSFSSVWAE